MRFLGVGDHVALGDMYLRLQAEGHEVRVFAEDAEQRDIMRGMVAHVTDWRAELPWVRAAGREGVVLFEGADQGVVQDELRAAGYQVIGNSAFGARLEEDRVFGQRVLAECGLQTAAMHRFTSFDAGADFLRRSPGRYVLKMNGGGFASFRNYVGEMEDGADIAAMLGVQRRRWPYDHAPDFVLMEHVRGVEVGVGAYFNGEAFLEPACLDWEHKRFFNGDLGELTGEMGTLVTYDGTARFMRATLGLLAPRLAAGGYVGYINLNTIVNERGVWPLELTARFGYPGYAILAELQATGWGELFGAMVGRSSARLAVRPGYAVGVVLTVPPFPYSADYGRLSRGAPIVLDAGLTAAERARLHYAEVAMEAGQLVTSGSVGYVMVATGAGPTVPAAQRAAYDLARRVHVPNVRYRTDIGDRFVREDEATLQRLGWLGERGAPSAGDAAPPGCRLPAPSSGHTYDRS